MPFLFITLPAFWLMFIAAKLLEAPVAAVLSALPLSVPLFIHDCAVPLALFGVVLAILGNYFQLTEMLRNKNTTRDVLFMFSGSVLVLAVFLTLPHWPLFIGRSIFAALTLFFPSALFGRAIMDRTDTAFSSVLLVILSIVGIIALTWLFIF